MTLEPQAGILVLKISLEIRPGTTRSSGLKVVCALFTTTWQMGKFAACNLDTKENN